MTFSIIFLKVQIPKFQFLYFFLEFVGGDVGLAITQMMSIAGLVQWGMRESAEVTNQMMSVERILEYLQIAPENNLRDKSEIVAKKKNLQAVSSILTDIPKEWPMRGAVEFKNVNMSYSEDDAPVLKDLSFYIKETDKVREMSFFY